MKIYNEKTGLEMQENSIDYSKGSVILKNQEDYIFHEYTQEELEFRNHNMQIVELKTKLYDTDYLAIKYLEGELSEEEYTPIRLQRRKWREEINQLEQK